MGRSVIAIIGGYFVMGLVIMFLFAAWSHQGNTPASDGFLRFTLLSDAAGAVLGGYVTARVARDAEMPHVIGLAAFGVFITLVAVVTSREPAPVWYQVLNAAVMIPSVLLGGYLRMHTKAAARDTRSRATS